MSRPALAPDLRRFVVTNVVSVPYLEAILLLRAEPERAWTRQAMAQRLYVSEDSAAALLQLATANGIAAPLAGPAEEQGAEAYGYRPASTELAALLDRLAAHYAQDVVTIATLIHGRTDKRAQQFADAFLWRKES